MLGTIAVLIRNNRCQTAQSGPAFRARCFFGVCTSGVLMVLWFKCWYVLLGPNFQTVITGQVYRGAQPSESQLRHIVEKWHIKTVINLRGKQPWLDWYRQETAQAKALGLRFEDVWLSPHRLPIPRELRRFIHLLDNIEYPVFIHCRRGADRTGFAAAIMLLLRDGVDADVALEQISARYGHLRIGNAACISRFFEQYFEWLRRTDRVHSSMRFRHWALHVYRADWSCEPLELVGDAPSAVGLAEATTFTVRARNNGTQTWHLRPTKSAGVHLWIQVYDHETDKATIHRAGLLNHHVAPGEAYDFTVVIPPLHRAGRYRILIDVIDERGGRFQRIGSELLALEIEARENAIEDRN